MPPLADATESLADALRDPKRWHVVKRAPMFYPHERVDPGRPPIKVDAAKLKRIHAQALDLERTRTWPAITEGHRIPGAPEADQPNLMGYMVNPQLGQRHGQPCLFYDLYLFPDVHPYVARRYPYRSADYHGPRERIYGCGLLLSPPYLDVGATQYAAASGVDHFYLTYEGDPVPTPTVQPTRYDANGEPEKKPDAPAAGIPPVDPDEPPGYGEWAKSFAHHCKKTPALAGAMAQYEASQPPAAPVAPAGGAAAPADPEKQAIAYQLEELRKQTAKLEAENRKAKAVTAVARELTGKRFACNADHEANILYALPEKDWANHLSEQRKYLRPLPGGDVIPTAYGVDEAANDGARSREEATAISRYKTDHGGSWDEAKAAVRAGKR